MQHYEYFCVNLKQLELLKIEAKSGEASADLVGSDTCALEFDIAVNDRGRCRVSGPGVVLRDFHRCEGLKFASKFSRAELEIFPTRASYIYYGAGDYSFFHHDAASAHITLIVPLSRGVTPILLFPNFGRASDQDITLLNRIENLHFDELSASMNTAFGVRGASVEVELPLGFAVAIPGRAIPHARPRQSSIGSVCTMCFSFIDAPERFKL